MSGQDLEKSMTHQEAKPASVEDRNLWVQHLHILKSLVASAGEPEGT